jgi:hypothetical protein
VGKRIERALLVMAALAAWAAGAPVAGARTGLIGTVELGNRVGFGRFIVDNPRHHVFLTEDQAGAVVEMSSGGRRLITIRKLPGAYGLAIGGRYLYVAVQAAGRIDRVDLTHPGRGARRFVTRISGPRWLAFTDHRLWVGTAPPSEGDSRVLSINPTTRRRRALRGPFLYGADFATSPREPSVLYLAEAESEPEGLFRFSLNAFPPHLTATNPRYWDGAWGGMALTADGSRLEGSAGGDGAFQELCSRTLRPDGIVYPGSTYPAAISTSASGLVATALSQYNRPDLAVYRTGVTKPFWTASDRADDGILDAGAILSADGRRLYSALTAPAVGGPAYLVHAYALPRAPRHSAKDPCPRPARPR